MEAGITSEDKFVPRRLAVLLICAAVLGVVSLGTMFVSVAKARAQVSAADDIALASAADVAQQLVLSYVGEAESVSRDLAGMLAVSEISADRIEPDLLRELQIHDYVRAVTVTYPDGRFFVARRDGDGFITRVVEPLADVPQTYRVYDADLAVTDVNHDKVGFAVTTASSYLAAIEGDGVQWTEPALREVTKRPGVWATTAARDQDGHVIAVVAADIYVERMGAALDEFTFGPSGETFILGGDRSVIAAPPSHSDEILKYAADFGLVAPAVVIGVQTTEVALPGSSESVFGTSGGLRTVERGLGEGGPPWVLHVQADEASINPAASQIAGTLTIPLILGSLALLFVLWSALTAHSLLTQVRRRVYTDPSSGLYMPRALGKLGARQIRRIQATDRVLCAAVIRVDGLDELARSRGAFALDAALLAVGDIIRLETRADDTAVRDGSGEFVVLISLPAPDGAVVAVERIRGHITDALNLGFGTEPPLMVSAGHAVAPRGNPDLDALIARARVALASGARLSPALSSDERSP